MERMFIHCPTCDDNMELEYRKGNWYCENCDTNLTKQVENMEKRKRKQKK